MIETFKIQFGRWNIWRQQSVNRRIFAAIVTVAGLKFFVYLAAVGKELVIAHQFGTRDALDAFLIALLIPFTAMNIVSGAFEVAFIPEYIRVREHEGEDVSKQLMGNIFLWYIILLIGLTVILAFSVPVMLPLLGLGFGPEKLALTQVLFFMLLPLLMIKSLTRGWASVLNAGERFALAAVSTISMHLVAILFLFGMGKAWGIRALALGMVFGFALEAALLIWGLWSHELPIFPKFPFLGASTFDASTKKVVQQYMPLLVGTLLICSTGFVDQAMAATLGPGKVSALNYGNKVVGVLLGIGSISLGSAVLPHFSKMVVREDWKGIRHTLFTYCRLILMFSIPLVVVFYAGSDFLTRLVFERGAFTEADTRLVGPVLALYALQIPFYMLVMLAFRLLSALSKNKTLMWISAVLVAVNMLGNYLFMQSLGVSGIALSTSFVYLVATALMFFSLKKELERRVGQK